MKKPLKIKPAREKPGAVAIVGINKCQSNNLIQCPVSSGLLASFLDRAHRNRGRMGFGYSPFKWPFNLNK